MIMRALFWMLAVASLALVSLTASARADEEAIPVKELPRAVRQAIEKKFPRAEIEEASKETEDGKTVYEVTLEVDEDQDVDVSLTADGKILEIEREIAFDKLPEAVRKTIARKYPGAEIEKVEAISSGDDGEETYEVLLEITTEVVLNAKGKISKAEEEDDGGETKAKKGKRPGQGE